MKINKIIALLVSFSMIACRAKDHNDYYNTWQYVDFDSAMRTTEFPESIARTKSIIGIDGTKVLAQFRALFNANNLSQLQPQTELKIPKIIHQVWLGSPLPEAFKQYMQTWLDQHAQGWHYKLWTDEDVALITLDNQKFYDESDNYGVKSDILKWEIVYRYGGVYIDMDFECLQPLDIFHYTYDFYTGLQPMDTQFVQLGAALFGAVPGHPILKHCIETIKDDWHLKGAPTKTGPVHFTKSFLAVAGKNGSKDIALPAFYFYPLASRQTELKRSQWIAEGAYAVHHWAKSWMPANYRQKKFKSIDNAESSKSWNA